MESTDFCVSTVGQVVLDPGFNRSNLREKINDSSIGLLAPEFLGKGGPDLHYLMLGDNAFALMPWMVKPYN